MQAIHSGFESLLLATEWTEVGIEKHEDSPAIYSNCLMSQDTPANPEPHGGAKALALNEQALGSRLSPLTGLWPVNRAVII